MFWKIRIAWQRWRRRYDIGERLSRFAPLFGIAAIGLLAAATGILYHFSLHVGLDTGAMDCAQVARNVASGRGLTTNILRPVQLEAVRPRPDFPDFANAPVYPVILGVVFALAGARDAVLQYFSLSLFVLASMLLALLAARLYGSLRVGMLAAATFAISMPVVTSADSGRPDMLCICFVLGLLLLLTPANRPDTRAAVASNGARRPPVRVRKRYAGAGLLAGLCILTNYASICYVIPVVLLWPRFLPSRPSLAPLEPHAPLIRRLRAGLKLLYSSDFFPFVVGAILVMLLWWIRNARLTGNPLHGLQWLSLLCHTSFFPGQSIYRSIGWHANFGQVLGGIFGLSKIEQGIFSLYANLPYVPHVYLLPFLIAAYFYPSEKEGLSGIRRAVAVALVSTGVGIILSAQDVTLSLVPLAPFFCFIAAVGFVEACDPRVDRWLFHREEHGRPMRYGTRERGRAGAAIVLVVVLMVPLAFECTTNWGKPHEGLAASITKMAKLLPSDGSTLTDQPEAVAWYGRHDTVWLPDVLAGLPPIDAERRIEAVYLSQSLLSQSKDVQLTEWQDLYRRGGNLEGFSPHVMSGGVLYTRLPTISDVERAAEATPSSATAQFSLGQAMLSAHKPLPALEAFRQVQRLQPRSALPYLGEGYALLQLKRYDSAAEQFRAALKRDPQLVPAASGLSVVLQDQGKLAEALNLSEEVLAAQPDNVEAMNNLAYLYNRMDRSPYRALEMARRAAAAMPRSGAVRDTLGWIQYRAHLYPAALQELSEAARLSPELPEVRYHLGKVLLAQGKTTEAAAAFKEAIALGLTGPEKADAESHS